MARIGEFVATENGYKGQVKTMEMRFDVQLVRIEGADAEGPHYQAVATNGADIGAAWDRQSICTRCGRCRPAMPTFRDAGGRSRRVSPAR